MMSKPEAKQSNTPVYPAPRSGDFVEPNPHLVPEVVDGVRIAVFVSHRIRPDEDHLSPIVADPHR